MRELLYKAASHFKEGRALAERGQLQAAVLAYGEAIRELHAVAPQRMRDVLLAQVHLSRYQVALELNPETALQDLRFGYSYARTARESAVEALAQKLWQEHLSNHREAQRLAGS